MIASRVGIAIAAVACAGACARAGAGGDRNLTPSDPVAAARSIARHAAWAADECRHLGGVAVVVVSEDAGTFSVAAVCVRPPARLGVLP